MWIGEGESAILVNGRDHPRTVCPHEAATVLDPPVDEVHFEPSSLLLCKYIQSTIWPGVKSLLPLRIGHDLAEFGQKVNDLDTLRTKLSCISVTCQ